MSDYLLSQGTKATPQSEPMRSDQILNEAGGYVWAIDKWARLRRFLILGSEGGSYYASERKLTTENVTSLRECVAEDGPRTVAEIVAISEAGRAPNNDPALYALAACFSLGDKETRLAAGKALPRVARIATHLYHFVAYAETMRGWGRMMRKAVSEWYAKNPEQLAYQAVKYRQRDGWSHRDLLRLAHPKNDANAAIFDWITHGGEVNGNEQPLIEAFQRAQLATNPAETAALVREYRLPREALLTEHLNDNEVWRALLETGMPLGALVRNLATMTKNGVLDGIAERQTVLAALSNEEQIRKSRLHPLAILIAQRTYASGRGFRGQNTWAPLPSVNDALDAAFYLAFGNVPATGKRILLAVDVSGSMMSGGVAGSPLTPREAGVAMALVTLHAEQDVEVVGYDTAVYTSGVSARQRLDDALNMFPRTGNGTDCSLPMQYASHSGKHYFDAFVQYTDNQTWYGRTSHPKQALDAYRRESGVAASCVVVGMVSNGFTIADPNDSGMLDVVGFDTATPGLISEFVAGSI